MKKFYDAVYWLFMSFCKLVFIASICITSYVVFCRYILHSTPRWGEQAILLCMVYMALISASLAVRTDTHIRVMLIDYLLPEKAISFLKAMSHVMIFGFSLFMIVYGVQFTILMSKSVMSGLGCKQSFLYASVPIAGVCMLLMQSEKFILYILKKLDKVPEEYKEKEEGGEANG
jgi:TRAP-type C4-dicarboxylate transport system permease small subunit